MRLLTRETRWCPIGHRDFCRIWAVLQIIQRWTTILFRTRAWIERGTSIRSDMTSLSKNRRTRRSGKFWVRWRLERTCSPSSSSATSTRVGLLTPQRSKRSRALGQRNSLCSGSETFIVVRTSKRSHFRLSQNAKVMLFQINTNETKFESKPSLLYRLHSPNEGAAKELVQYAQKRYQR